MATNRIVFVTGANRGIGLEFARQLTARGDIVVAGYRDPERSAELLGMAENTEHLYAIPVDVTEEEAVERVRDLITKKFGRLDLLINNAGIHIKYSDPIDRLKPVDLMENFRVNVIGPFLAARILHPLLAKSDRAAIINISSTLGSIERSTDESVPYSISKAALNMLSKKQAMAYRKDGILTVALSPGWVRTDMGGPNASLHPSESVSRMLKVIDDLTPDDSGAFIGYDGQPRPY